MKNNLSISLLALAFICVLGNKAFALEPESHNDEITYEVSADELAILETNCKEIGMNSGMEFEELSAFVDECIAANSIHYSDENININTGEVVEDTYSEDTYELPTENEDVLLDDSELTTEESPS